MSAPKKRRFGAFGSIDRKYRQWRYLPGVRHGSGARPDGERLVYRLNETTLEIGGGGSFVRGYLWPLGLMAILVSGMLTYGVLTLYSVEDIATASGMGAMVYAVFAIGLLVVVIGLCFGGLLFIGDLFGYTDAPVRFDRARRRIYAWRDHPQGPEEYDWDAVKVVTQDVRGPPQVATSFKSVLLVDEDEHGEVRFSRKVPRIVQIGEVSASPEQTLQAYEFVRLFMEQGPAALPPVRHYLSVRRRGLRAFVDVLGMMRATPIAALTSSGRPPRERALAAALIAGIGLLAPVLMCFQIAHGIAMHTCRTPHWPATHEALAASGGPMRPPPGASPDHQPLQRHEQFIGAFWLLCAIAGWAWLIGR